MAMHKGTYTWPSTGNVASEYQTALNGLLTAIAGSSTSWAVVKAATIFNTDGVFGVVEHSSGLQVALYIGAAVDLIDPSNWSSVGNTSETVSYRRVCVSMCPPRGTGYNLSSDPSVANWCSDAVALPFARFCYAEMIGALRYFEWVVDDTAGWMLINYLDQARPGVDEFMIISGDGNHTVYRPSSVAASDTKNEFMRWWARNYFHANSQISSGGLFRCNDGSVESSFMMCVNDGVMSATYNPTEPWVYEEVGVFVAALGMRGSISQDLFGYIRDGATSDYTSLEGGAFEHIHEGLVWVSP